VVNDIPQSLYPVKDPVPIVQDAGLAPGLVLAGSENPAPMEFDLWTVQPVPSSYIDWAIPVQYVLDEFKSNKIGSHDII